MNEVLVDQLPPDVERRSVPVLDPVRAGDRSSARESFRRGRWMVAAGGIVILLWLSYFAGLSAMLDLGNSQQARGLYVPRAIVTVAGILISFCIVVMQARLRNPSMTRRAQVAILSAIFAPAVQSVLNIRIFNAFFPDSSPRLGWLVFASDYAWRFWIWIATCGAILAMSYAADIRERERRILLLQNLAHSAQLRALRFQLNPHFLFNALNSVAGLISARRIEDAETMTENLGDFLRFTLALDPQKLITLDEELHLQRLYLEMEKKRFPDRLLVEVDVPAELGSVLIPSLLTQPLIENSIKYAVARSSLPVELKITARKIGGKLELIVADSGGDSGKPAGTGACLGLRNVADRIRMHYGEHGRLTARASAAGGFCNQVTIPVELAG